MRAHLAPDVHCQETGTGRRVDGGWHDTLPDIVGTVRTAILGDGIAALEIRWDVRATITTSMS